MHSTWGKLFLLVDGLLEKSTVAQHNALSYTITQIINQQLIGALLS